MREKDYSEKFKDHLLEQYKLFVEMADRVSNRRMQTNMFYTSLLSCLITVISISKAFKLSNVVILTVSVLGVIICVLWCVHISSYRKLNAAKFEVIHMIEQYLPYPCYREEWKLLEQSKYRLLSKIEQVITITFAIVFFLIFLITLLIITLYDNKKVGEI